MTWTIGMGLFILNIFMAVLLAKTGNIYVAAGNAAVAGLLLWVYLETEVKQKWM